MLGVKYKAKKGLRISMCMWEMMFTMFSVLDKVAGKAWKGDIWVKTWSKSDVSTMSLSRKEAGARNGAGTCVVF